jgi:hypothetical protein
MIKFEIIGETIEGEGAMVKPALESKESGASCNSRVEFKLSDGGDVCPKRSSRDIEGVRREGL